MLSSLASTPTVRSYTVSSVTVDNSGYSRIAVDNSNTVYLLGTNAGIAIVNPVTGGTTTIVADPLTTTLGIVGFLNFWYVASDGSHFIVTTTGKFYGFRGRYPNSPATLLFTVTDSIGGNYGPGMNSAGTAFYFPNSTSNATTRVTNFAQSSGQGTTFTQTNISAFRDNIYGADNIGNVWGGLDYGNGVIYSYPSPGYSRTQLTTTSTANLRPILIDADGTPIFLAVSTNSSAVNQLVKLSGTPPNQTFVLLPGTTTSSLGGASQITSHCCIHIPSRTIYVYYGIDARPLYTITPTY